MKCVIMLSASNYLYFLQLPLIQQKIKQMQHLTATLQIGQRVAIHGQQDLLKPVIQAAKGRQFLLQNRAVPRRISHLYIILSAASLPMGKYNLTAQRLGAILIRKCCRKTVSPQMLLVNNRIHCRGERLFIL